MLGPGLKLGLMLGLGSEIRAMTCVVARAWARVRERAMTSVS